MKIITLVLIAMALALVSFFSATAEERHVDLRFQAFWVENGGVEIFGYPISDPEMDGDTLVQYFERARFEYHPENSGGYEILLTNVGVDAYSAYKQSLVGQDVSLVYVMLAGECEYFDTTSQNVCGVFFQFWQRHGVELGDCGISFRESLALFGYPISPTLKVDGKIVQYFERARFELREDGTVQLGLVGTEYLTQKRYLH